MRSFSLVVIIALTQPALADKSTRTDYYSISGSTGAQLLTEIDAKGPQGFSGYTRYELDYSYQTQMNNGRCRSSRTVLDLAITYTMPRWETRPGASAELQAGWDEWYRLLELHERGHGALAEAAYEDILDTWRLTGYRESCQEIRNEVEQAFGSILARLNQENVEYDRRTDHGRSQGLADELLLTGQGASPTQPREVASSDFNYWWLVFGGLAGLLYWIRRS